MQTVNDPSTTTPSTADPSALDRLAGGTTAGVGESRGGGPSSNRTAPQTMRAVTQVRYGEADVLGIERIGRPTPASDEVLIRVRAAGLDRGVWHLMAGLPYVVRLAGYGLRRPKQPVPGADVAGVVEAVGAGVTTFAPGDEVLGIGSGTFAEYAVAPAAKLVRRPASVSWPAAGALAMSGITAYQAVVEHAGVGPGERVLVIGASGGVGSYAVQIAKSLGAHVTGVASTAKLDRVRILGADDVVDYTTTEITDGPDRFDVIIDTGGNRRLRVLRRALERYGRLVIVGGEAGGRFIGGTDRQLRAMVWSRFVSQDLKSFISPENADDIQAVVDLVVAGDVTPAIDRVFSLEDVVEAMSHVVAGRALGKVVIRP